MTIEPGKNYIVQDGDDEENNITVWVSEHITDETTKFLSISVEDDEGIASIDLTIEDALKLRAIIHDCVDYIGRNPPKCFKCNHRRHSGSCVNVAPNLLDELEKAQSANQGDADG